MTEVKAVSTKAHEMESLQRYHIIVLQEKNLSSTQQAETSILKITIENK